jgi:hypothetical protein
MSVEKINQLIEKYNEFKDSPQDLVSVKNEIIEHLAEMAAEKAPMRDLEAAKTFLQANQIFAPYQDEILAEIAAKISPLFNLENKHYALGTQVGREAYAKDQAYFNEVLDLFALPDLAHHDDYTEIKATFESNANKIAEEMQKGKTASIAKIRKNDFIPGEYEQYEKLILETGLFRLKDEDQFITEPLLTEGNQGIVRAPLFQVYLRLWDNRPVDASYLSRWNLTGALTGPLPPYAKMRRYTDTPPAKIAMILSELQTLGSQLNALRPLFEALAKARGLELIRQNGMDAWSLSFSLASTLSSMSVIQQVRKALTPSKLAEYRQVLGLPTDSSLTAIIDRLKHLSQQYQLKEVELNVNMDSKNDRMFLDAQTRAPQVWKLFDYLEATHCIEYVTEASPILRVREGASPLAKELAIHLVDSGIDFKVLRIFVEAIPEKREELLALSYERDLEGDLARLPAVLDKTNQVWGRIDKCINEHASSASSSRNTRGFKAPVSFLSLDELTPITADSNLLSWPNIKSAQELAIGTKKVRNNF